MDSLLRHCPSHARPLPHRVSACGKDRYAPGPQRGATVETEGIHSVPIRSSIELRDLEITTDVGTYGPDDIVPNKHVLDLTLGIDPRLVLIDGDGMDGVFDYDPLIASIDALARDGHYETQERLMTRIVEACAAYSEIEAVELMLRKTPVLAGTGHLGVRLTIDREGLSEIRQRVAAR